MSDTITSISGLLWPLLAISVLLVVRKPLMEVVRSAKDREWALEVGGQKLNMKELSDQQNSMIADLQNQFGVLHEEINEFKEAPSETAALESATATLKHDQKAIEAIPNSVLWVDDYPTNNALITEQLQRNGVRVDVALNTHEGLKKLSRRPYGAVISDMDRREDGGEVLDAGIKLLREVRQTDSSIPFLIYCGSRAAGKYQDTALAAGANVITSSSAVLTQKLQSIGLL